MLSHARFVVLLVALSGCTGQTEPRARPVFPGDQRSNGDFSEGDVSRGDVSPGDHSGAPCEPGGFCVVVEPGAQACGHFMDNRTWREEIGALGRATFFAQERSLPTDGQPFSADLIQQIEIGPSRTVATPVGPGIFTYEYLDYGNDPAKRVHTFDFDQAFDLDGASYTLHGEIHFGYMYTEETEIRVGVEFANGYFSLNGCSDPCDYASMQSYGACGMTDLPLYVITTETTGGDRLVLHKRFEPPIMGSGPAALVLADVELGGSDRSVVDYFSLVYAALHHNWAETYVVLLDPPLGSTHGLLLSGQDELVYLDADLNEVRQEPLSRYELTEP